MYPSKHADVVLRFAEDEQLRKEMYILSHSSLQGIIFICTFLLTLYAENVEILDRLLEQRYKLSKLLGFKTPAHMCIVNHRYFHINLRDIDVIIRFLTDPNQIKSFLDDLSTNINPKAEK